MAVLQFIGWSGAAVASLCPCICCCHHHGAGELQCKALSLKVSLFHLQLLVFLDHVHASQLVYTARAAVKDFKGVGARAHFVALLLQGLRIAALSLFDDSC